MALNLAPIQGEKVADLVRLLRGWRDQLQAALSCPAVTAQGKLVEATLASGTNEIAHGLGAAPSGWLALRIRGATACALSEVSSDSKTLSLNASTSATVTLWVWP